jgi:hypothetical protein
MELKLECRNGAVLSYLSHTLSRTDRIEQKGQTNRMNQFPATRLEMGFLNS